MASLPRTPTSLTPPLAARLLLGGVLAIACFAPALAEAKGTYFLIELETGVAESAYRAGSVGLTYGASVGTTWKFKFMPVRFALLGTVVGRGGTVDGFHEGVAFSADRTDLDLYLAQRVIFPVWRFVRVYGELGVGQRRQSEVLKRGGDLGTLTSHSNELLLVVAAGVEARLNRTFSVGVRGEVTPLDPDPDFTTIAANLAPTQNRTALMVQLGIHF